MSDDLFGDEWMDMELERLHRMRCLCEPCKCRGRGCDDCDGMAVATFCERCEQINELEMSISQGRREQHGHFGSF